MTKINYMNYTHELYNKHLYQTKLAVIKDVGEITVIMDEDDRLYEFPNSEDGLYENEDWAVRKLRIYQEI